jgi:hypothetical protein
MKAFSYNLTASIKKIKKTHKRTKVVSAIYAVGLIFLTVLAFFPTINIQFAGKDKLFIGTFFWPIVNIFKKNLNVIDLVVMLLYLVMMTSITINFFKGLSRFGKILRRTSGNVTTCNKNLAIMEEIANAFSNAFACYVIFNFVIYMITYATESRLIFGAITLWAAIALVVALIVHFWAAILGAKVSVFIIGATIEEMSGHSRESLTVLTTMQDDAMRYDFVWATAGEGGDLLGRGIVLDDGNYHYTMTVLRDADTVQTSAVVWDEVFSSFRLN